MCLVLALRWSPDFGGKWIFDRLNNGKTMTLTKLLHFDESVTTKKKWI